MMTDKDQMNEALMLQKQIGGSYDTYANECACTQLRNGFMNILKEEHEIQAVVFDEMSKRGWYQLKQAQPQQIDQVKQRFTSQT